MLHIPSEFQIKLGSPFLPYFAKFFKESYNEEEMNGMGY
jgi:hypothetical protein